MKLPELRELAKRVGLKSITALRKPQLIAAIENVRSEAVASIQAEHEHQPDQQRVSGQGPQAPRNTRQTRGRKRKNDNENIPRVRVSHPVPEEGPADLLEDLGIELPDSRSRSLEDGGTDKLAQLNADLDNLLAAIPDRSGQNGGDTARTASPQSAEHTDRRGRGEDRQAVRRDRTEQPEHRGRKGYGSHDDSADVRGSRDSRDPRAARREADDQQPAESMVPVAGIVDILDSYAFVRTSGYLPGPSDVYVSMGQVKKYGLRKGDAVRGFIRPQREGEKPNKRQKFVPLQVLDSINGMTVEEASRRPQFSKLTPLYPQERLKMETAQNKLTGRVMDIFAPIGKGQRGLIVSPPKAGKTITLQDIANAISANNPEVHLMVVLVDERPEEVTDMQRTVQGEVISSTFDRPATDHTTVAELAIERAQRLVELGQDVVVLLDSMTRLARAYNIAQPASGRILSGGVDAQALYPPKKFFGAARNIEDGGSLTIISSALVETGSKMDEVIFEEFKGTGNMELRLSRELSEKRMFPAIDINASGTRREELITPPQELAIVYRLRRALGGLEPEAAYQQVVTRLKQTKSNHDFLALMAQGTASN